MARVGWTSGLLLVVLTVGCAASDIPAVASPNAAPPTAAATLIGTPITSEATLTPTPVASPTADLEPVSWSVRVSRLTIPAEGIATPEQAFAGLENKAWIFGHSRWQNQPGLFHALQDINIGDEVLIDGVDRRTGEPVIRQRFVVEGIYLTDKESGAELVTADDPRRSPSSRPLCSRPAFASRARTSSGY